MADGTSAPVASWRGRLGQRVERARFDPCVRLDHLFLVDGHTLNVSGQIDRRVVDGPAALVVSPAPLPTSDALRTAIVVGRSRSRDTTAFSAHLDLTPLLRASAPTDRPPTLSVWVEGLKDGPHAATLNDDAVTGRNGETMLAVPPARDLGLQLGVERDELARLSITTKRLIPGWFLLRTDLVGTRLIALCRPSPLGAVMDTVAAVGPDNTPSVPCEIEHRGRNIAVHIDLVALSDATALGRTSTWTVRAAAPAAKSTAVGRGRSDLIAPTDPGFGSKSSITLSDRRLTVTVRWTQRSSLAIDLRHRSPRESASDDTPPDEMFTDGTSLDGTSSDEESVDETSAEEPCP